MKDNPPAVDHQREFLVAQIAAHRREHWNVQTLARAYQKAGLDEAARVKAEAAAGLERVVDTLEAMLDEL